MGLSNASRLPQSRREDLLNSPIFVPTSQNDTKCPTFQVCDSAKINRLALRKCSGSEPVFLVVFRAQVHRKGDGQVTKNELHSERVQPDYFFAAFFAGLAAAFFFGDGLAAVLAAGFAAAA